MADTSRPNAAMGRLRKPLHFSLSADRGWRQRFQLAATDLEDGARLWRLVWALALADIKLRYRGSALGPFWLTISSGVQIGAMAFVYAGLFRVDIRQYLPFLAVSIILWNFLSSLITEGCTCFSQSDALIKGARMPFTVHAARSVVRNTIVLAHNIVVVVAVLVIMDVDGSFYSLAVIPAFCLWVIDAFAISLLLGAFCARFRDVPQIVASMMQVAFFVTPVMWSTSILENHSRAELLIRYNPFFYMLEILRAPLLGTPVTADVALRALFISAAILIVSWIGFARARGRVAYWV